MSFGFSAGEFLAVGKQIKDISSLIRHASASYQALDVELHTLKRALDEIEHIQCPVGQELAINKVKVTALNCRQLLDGFESKLKKYAVLNQQHGSNLGKTHALQKLGRKVEWGIEMEEEAIKLRAAIVAHVGFLNLRLSSLGLNASFFAAQKLEEHRDHLTRELGQIRDQVVESRREHAAQGSLIAATSSLILNQVSEIASACIGVRLDSLLVLAQNIWNSNVQIIALVSEMQNRSPKPDTSHTWFQDPIRFEDAFGRVFPIPSEYSWSTVHAIILDQFTTGPGSQKVKSGEYLLYNSLDSKNPLRREHGPLMPGMSITMTLILGRYGSPTLDRCPRVGCLSFKVVNGDSGNKLCTLCRCWFLATSFSIACPLRFESSVASTTGGGKILSGRKKRRQGLAEPSFAGMMQNLDERRSFKNLSIYTMDLPKTPDIANVRRSGIRHRQKVKPADLASRNCVFEYENKFSGVTFPARKSPVIVDKRSPPKAHRSKQSDMFDVNSVNSCLSGDTLLTSEFSIRSAPTVVAKAYSVMPPPSPPTFPYLCTALCSWEGDSKGDLSFQEGDIIYCPGPGRGSRWVGHLWEDYNASGTFPSNFVEVIYPALLPGGTHPPPTPPPTPFESLAQKPMLSMVSVDLEEDTASGKDKAYSTKNNATSTGSFALLNHQRTNGALVTHESALESVGVRLPDRATEQPSVFAELIGDVNICAASSLHQTYKQDSTSNSTIIALESKPSSTTSNWHQLRCDINRSHSPSRDEKLERMKRCQMNFPALNPVDKFTETVQGDEDANGVLVTGLRDYQALNLHVIDRVVRLIMELPLGTTAIATLATTYVSRPDRSDVHRLRAIFTWVTKMICWEDNIVDEMGSRSVIQRKYGSPEKYAVLVMDMCAAVGIKCEMVRGYLKAPGEVVDTSKPMVPNHWWNAVVAHDEWRIMDCCLASPPNPNRPQYSRIDKGTTDYWWFLTRPTESCWTHVPENYDHQHIVPPIDIDVLRQLPCASATFFDNKIEMLDFNTSMTRIHDLEIMHIKFNVPDDVEVVAVVELLTTANGDGDGIDDGVKNLALAQAEWHEGVKRYTIKAFLPANKTRGTLKIYAGQRGLMHSIKDNPHPLAFCLPVVHSGTNEPYEFVTRHPTPHAQRHDIYLVQPQCRRLALNNTFAFAIRQHPSSLPIVDGSVAIGPFDDLKPAKTAIQTPGGKIIRLMRKSGGQYGKLEGMDDESRIGSVWGTICKCSERGTWRGLVLADRTERWCVFAEWICT